MVYDARLRRRPPGFATWFVTLCMAGWMACASPPAPQDVIVLGLGDLSPATLQSWTEPGPDLPNLKRLMQQGAAGPLAVPGEASTAGLWTTVATGRALEDHGVGISMDRPATSHGLRVPALWHRVSAADRRVAVVGWPGTWPVDDVAGQMISQHAFLPSQGIQDASKGLAEALALPRTVHPASLRASMPERLSGLGPEDDPYVTLARSLHLAAQEPAAQEPAAHKPRRRPDLLMLYRPALSLPEADRLVGDFLARAGATTRLLVIALPSPGSSSNGRVVLWGPDIQHQKALPPGQLEDLAPTVLAWLGLSLPSDLPGGVLEDAFASHPNITRVASHDPATNKGSAGEGLPRVGFLRGFPRLPPDSPRAAKDMAHLALVTGRADQAESIYHHLLDASPGDAVLHRRLAAALGAQGRYDEALASVEQALRLDPLQPAAYHHRARLSELTGNNPQAYADYKTALLFDPVPEGTLQGLQRLGAQPRLHAPSNAEDEEAARLIQSALQKARDQDYDGALELLEQAENASPPYVVTYLVRANVYYLKGKIKEAIKALELATRVEPDNALFVQNLKRLKAEPPRKPPKS